MIDGGENKFQNPAVDRMEKNTENEIGQKQCKSTYRTGCKNQMLAVKLPCGKL